MEQTMHLVATCGTLILTVKVPYDEKGVPIFLELTVRDNLHSKTATWRIRESYAAQSWLLVLKHMFLFRSQLNEEREDDECMATMFSDSNALALAKLMISAKFYVSPLSVWGTLYMPGEYKQLCIDSAKLSGRAQTHYDLTLIELDGMRETLACLVDRSLTIQDMQREAHDAFLRSLGEASTHSP